MARFRRWMSNGCASEMEKIYADSVYAMQSADAEWWEKTSAQGWLRFIEVARRFSLPASFELLLVFRTTFSYDTIVHRLDRKIDVVKAWQGYQRERAMEARKRVKDGFKQRLRGPSDMDYLQMEEAGDMLTLFFFQLQRNIEIRFSTSGTLSERSRTSPHCF